MTFYPNPRKVYPLVPDVANGFSLEQGKGWVAIVKPEAGINLCENPSFESNISGSIYTGWTAINSTRLISVEEQYRGIFSLKITPTLTSLEAGVYYTLPTTLTGNHLVTWSIYLLGHPGQIYQVYQGAAGSRDSKSQLTQVRGTGRWQRLSCVCDPGAGASKVFVVSQPAGGSALPFYVDCAQIEESAYLTTYMDGDQDGPTFDRSVCYYWDRAPHASRSIRLSNGNGGREINLLDIGFNTMAIVGLGMMPVNNISLPIATGGALYQRTIYQPRDFIIGGYLSGDSLSDLQRQRRQLIEAIDPFSTRSQSTLLLKVYLLDDDGQEEAVAEIECSYQSGLEGTLDNLSQDRLGISFRQFSPLIRGSEMKTINWAPPAPVSSSKEIARLTREGVFTTSIPGSAQFDETNAVAVFAVDSQGNIYFGGEYVAPNYQSLMMWNGLTLAKPGGLVGPNGTVNKILPAKQDVTAPVTAGSDPDLMGPVVYVCGDFLNVDTIGGVGLANTRGIGKFINNAWAAIGTGADDGEVLDMLIKDDTLYVIGTFTQMGGVAGTDKIAKWVSGDSNWTPLDTGLAGLGLDGVPTSIVDMGDQGIGVGVSFGSVPGGLFSWDGEDWNVATFMLSGLVNSASDLFLGIDGKIYGKFVHYWEDTPGSLSLQTNLAAWNGVYLEKIDAWSQKFESIAMDPSNGDFYGGYPNTAPITALSGKRFFYSLRNKLTHILGLSTVPKLNALVTGLMDTPAFFNPNNGDLYFARETSTTQHYTQIQVATLNNDARTLVYPRIYAKGPATLYGVRNRTTGQAIYFRPDNPLVLGVGEVLTLKAEANNLVMFTNERYDLTSFLDGDSTPIFALLPGDNLIEISFDGYAIGRADWGTDVAPVFYGTDVLICGASQDNTDAGRLYSKVTKYAASPTWTYTFYKDFARTQLVASGTHDFTWPGGVNGLVYIQEENASGLTGAFLSNFPGSAPIFPLVDPLVFNTIFDIPLFYFSWRAQYLALDQLRP